MPFRINLALDLGAKKQIGEGVKDRHGIPSLPSFTPQRLHGINRRRAPRR
jgi:hypothetical protein